MCAPDVAALGNQAFRVVYVYGLWASHRISVMLFFCGRSASVRSCSVGPPVCPVSLGFRSVGSRVCCQVSLWTGAVSKSKAHINIHHGTPNSLVLPHRAHKCRRPRLTGEAPRTRNPRSKPTKPSPLAPAAARHMPPVPTHLRCNTLAPPRASRTRGRRPRDALGVPGSTNSHTPKAQAPTANRDLPPQTQTGRQLP